MPLALWAIKAVLFATGDTPRPAPALLHGPHLFPFDLPLPSITDLESSHALDLSHHGLNRELLLGLSPLETAPN